MFSELIKTYKSVVKYFLFSALFFIVFIALTKQSNAQFYNGHQMSFGKNRVQYREFLWQFYRFEKFDTYYYVNGKELAELTGKIASEEICRVDV